MSLSLNDTPARAPTPVDVAPDYIRSLPPYIPGRAPAQVSRELGVPAVCMMASNENPLGASPRAVAAMQQVLAQVGSYPDPNGFDLKAALQRRFGLGEPAGQGLE